MRIALIFLLAALATSAASQPSAEVVCSYAPSQSNAVASLSGAVGGAGAAVGAVGAATGLSVVMHSSGALILTGASGYIAGTIGAAAAAPLIVAVSLVVGGTAVTIEVICATKNHPDEVAKVQEAAVEFSRRFGVAMHRTVVAVGDMRESVEPAAGRAAVEVRRIATGVTDVWQYAYRKSADVLLNK